MLNLNKTKCSQMDRTQFGKTYIIKNIYDVFVLMLIILLGTGVIGMVISSNNGLPIYYIYGYLITTIIFTLIIGMIFRLGNKVLFYQCKRNGKNVEDNFYYNMTDFKDAKKKHDKFFDEFINSIRKKPLKHILGLFLKYGADFCVLVIFIVFCMILNFRYPEMGLFLLAASVMLYSFLVLLVLYYYVYLYRMCDRINNK